MQKYQKKIILFPAGASGHFLSAFLTTGSTHVMPQTRIDLGQTISSAVFVGNDLEKIKDTIADDFRQTILTHYNRVSDLREFANQHWVRKIYPLTDVFGWLKNVFYKKQQIENVDFRQAELITQFDAMFENMKNFYFQLKSDTDCPADLTIDFGKIKDLKYLEQLYIEANGVELPSKQIKFAEEYLSMQGKTINDYDNLDIEELVVAINPQDLYDLVILLFIYEKNHNTIDNNRLWTIDNLPTQLSKAVEFLVDNSRNYSIFK